MSCREGDKMHRQLELIENIKREFYRITKLEQQMTADLKNIPEGFLMKRKDGRIFHVIKKNGEKEIIRLNLDDEGDVLLFHKLKYKKYIKEALPVLNEWIKQLKNILRKVSVYDPLRIEERLKDQYHGLSGLPIFLEGDINPETWGNKNGSPMYKEGLIHPSENGLMTRSKSEAQIASKYERLGWKMVYEPVIRLPDGRVLRPDFAVLHPIKRKVIYHEHLGMMDDPEYAMNAIKKLDDYASIGIVLGENLVVTTETKNQPLTFQAINEVIKKIESM